MPASTTGTPRKIAPAARRLPIRFTNATMSMALASGAWLQAPRPSQRGAPVAVQQRPSREPLELALDGVELAVVEEIHQQRALGHRVVQGPPGQRRAARVGDDNEVVEQHRLNDVE